MDPIEVKNYVIARIIELCNTIPSDVTLRARIEELLHLYKDNNS